MFTRFMFAVAVLSWFSNRFFAVKRQPTQHAFRQSRELRARPIPASAVSFGLANTVKNRAGAGLLPLALGGRAECCS